jgi:hypothetical protein
MPNGWERSLGINKRPRLGDSRLCCTLRGSVRIKEKILCLVGRRYPELSVDTRFWYAQLGYVELVQSSPGCALSDPICGILFTLSVALPKSSNAARLSCIKNSRL